MKNKLFILEFDIWNLPEDEIYLKLKNEFRVNFLSKAIKISGGWAKFTNFLKITESSLSYYKNGICFIPLRIIKNILNFYPKNMKDVLVKEIKQNIEEVKVGYSRKEIKINKCNIPNKFTYLLARIAGHLTGDGGINERCNVYYANKCEMLVEQFKRDIKREFRNIKNLEYIDHKGVKSVRFPKFVGIILQNLLGKMSGHFKHVPEIILNSDKTCRKLFLRALFDDEGSVRVKEHKIEIKMANESIIKTIKEMLSEFDIKVGRISRRKYKKPWRDQFRFIISGRRNIENYYREIGFDHRKKKEKLRISLQNYEMTYYKPEEIRKLILDILRREGDMSMYELAKKLNKKPHSQFSKILSNIEKMGLITSRKVGKGLKIYTINSMVLK